MTDEPEHQDRVQCPYCDGELVFYTDRTCHTDPVCHWIEGIRDEFNKLGKNVH